jgi:hypothetical protein
MSDLVFQHEGIILDADCTISLASSGVFADILKTFPCQCTITQYVLQQEVLRNDIQPCIDLGLLQMVKPQGEEYDIILSIHDEVNVLNRFHLFCVLLAHGKKRTQLRATALEWGVLFFRRSRKNNTPHQNGEREGTRFPHTPASDTH